MDHKELRVEESPKRMGKIEIYEVTVLDNGKVVSRHIVCEMNTLHPGWRDYADLFIAAAGQKAS